LPEQPTLPDHDLWVGLSVQIRKYLKGITLAELLEKNQVKEIAIRQDKDPQHIIEIHRHSEVNA
jgi:Rrf2 family iron-sulfur cluster assembly transcriptional regulator